MLLGRLILDRAASAWQGTVGRALGVGGTQLGTTGDGRGRLRRAGAKRQGIWGRKLKRAQGKV